MQRFIADNVSCVLVWDPKVLITGFLRTRIKNEGDKNFQSGFHLHGKQVATCARNAFAQETKKNNTPFAEVKLDYRNRHIFDTFRQLVLTGETGDPDYLKSSKGLISVF